MRFYLYCAAIFLLAVFFAGCKPKPLELPPMPDMEKVKQYVSSALDRGEKEVAPKEILDGQVGMLKNQVDACEDKIKTGSCDLRTASNYYLALGDVLYDLERFEDAAASYKQAILARYEAFEGERKIHETHMKINTDERKKQGDLDNLLAGGAFLETRFAFTAYKDYAEMVRSERRMGEALKGDKKDEDAATALVRAQLALDKTLEYRESFEKKKRDLMVLTDKLTAEFAGFNDYIETWTNQVDIPRI